MVASIVGDEVLILLLVIAGGVFTGIEIAIGFANRDRLKQLSDSGDPKSRQVLEFAETPHSFLPATRLGTAFFAAFAGIYAGATFTFWLEDALAHSAIPIVREFPGLTAIVLSIPCLALLLIVFGVQVPRQVAQQYAMPLSRFGALPLRALARWTRPATWLADRLSQAVLRLCGLRVEEEPGVSVGEIEHLIQVGTDEGVLEPVEQKLAVEALRLGDRTVRHIMQPRIDIDAADVNTPPQEVLGVVAMAGFSRLPVYEGDLDHILGFVHMKDALRQQYLGWPLDLRKLVRPALFVPDTMRVAQLLVDFQEQRNQLAIVVDEFGGTKGMVTLEHVLEELVGEIAQEPHAQDDRKIVQQTAESWLVDGAVRIEDLLVRLAREHLGPAVPRSVHTVAGLILAEFGRIPAVGDVASWSDLRIEVNEMEGQRIERALVTIAEKHVSES